MITKRRPFLALVLLVAAVFLALGDQCGILGQHLTGFAVRYVGQLGTALVVLSLIASAYALGAPAGTAVKLARVVRARRQVPPALIDVAREIEEELLPKAPPTTRDRRKADDVRSAMKSLGYLKREYDLVVATLDLSLPLDKLVRQSIQTLYQQKRES
jgi:hypothetical protein